MISFTTCCAIKMKRMLIASSVMNKWGGENSNPTALEDLDITTTHNSAYKVKDSQLREDGSVGYETIQDYYLSEIQVNAVHDSLQLDKSRHNSPCYENLNEVFTRSPTAK